MNVEVFEDLDEAKINGIDYIKKDLFNKLADTCENIILSYSARIEKMERKIKGDKE